MQFSSIPGKTSVPASTPASTPAATPGVSDELSAALTNWLAEARLAISHDPRTADRYWDRSAWRRGQQLRRVEAPALDHGLVGVSYRFCSSINAIGPEKKLTTEPEPSSNRMGAASASLTQEI